MCNFCVLQFCSKSMIEDDLARKKAKEAEKAKDKDKKKSPKPQRRVVDAAAISPRR